jgi:beta-glucosidase
VLPAESFKYYDEAKKQWVLAPGKFGLLVGSSSRDIRQTGSVTL